MALGLVATIPAPGGALGLSLLHWPLAGRPSMASDAQCYYFKPDPVSFRLGSVPSRGQCALVLCPPRAGPDSRAKLQGIYPPTLPGYGFKAAEQCKLGSPGPARLLLHAQECQRLLSASCAAG